MPMPSSNFADHDPLTPPVSGAARLALAPMEGVVDAGVRQLIGDIGGIDFCVTEFLRVTTELQPNKTFYKICPELKQQAKTTSGIPVHFQLLGSHPELLAEHAVKAARLGARVVDLNFGCPAKLVNRHKGGAVLLQTPDQIHRIVSACAEALADTPARLTAKMRLGYEDTSLVYENVAAINAGGATELVVHARTKIEGYKPPAHWEWLAKIRTASAIPVIANGEVWSVDDYQRCRQVSGCADVMLGRGLIADPYFAHRIRSDNHQLPTQADLAAALLLYLQREAGNAPDKFLLSRGKQWLGMMNKGLVSVRDLFDQIKICQSAPDMLAILTDCSQQTGHYKQLLPQA